MALGRDLGGQRWVALHLLADQKNVAFAPPAASASSTAGVPCGCGRRRRSARRPRRGPRRRGRAASARFPSGAHSDATWGASPGPHQTAAPATASVRGRIPRSSQAPMIGRDPPGPVRRRVLRMGLRRPGRAGAGRDDGAATRAARPAGPQPALAGRHGADAAGALLQVWALSLAPITVVQPTLAVGLLARSRSWPASSSASTSTAPTTWGSRGSSRAMSVIAVFAPEHVGRAPVGTGSGHRPRDPRRRRRRAVRAGRPRCGRGRGGRGRRPPRCA